MRLLLTPITKIKRKLSDNENINKRFRIKSVSRDRSTAEKNNSLCKSEMKIKNEALKKKYNENSSRSITSSHLEETKKNNRVLTVAYESTRTEENDCINEHKRFPKGFFADKKKNLCPKKFFTIEPNKTEEIKVSTKNEIELTEKIKYKKEKISLILIDRFEKRNDKSECMNKFWEEVNESLILNSYGNDQVSTEFENFIHHFPHFEK